MRLINRIFSRFTVATDCHKTNNSSMSATLTTRSPVSPPVKQFSIFADNKVGRLHDIITSLKQREITILGFCTIDTTDSAIIRLVVNYWEHAKQAFREMDVNFALNDMLAVELQGAHRLIDVTTALQQAEVNIHYAYPLLVQPRDWPAAVFRLEDHDLAREVLVTSGVRVFDQNDLAR